MSSNASPSIPSTESRSYYRGASTYSRTWKPTRRLSGDFTPSSAWPHLEEFVESGGNIQIGPIAPIKCAAVAADPHGMIAALVRRNGESFNDLIHRLDHAVDMAMNHDAPTDEINKR
jgi:hypothetical protein